MKGAHKELERAHNISQADDAGNWQRYDADQGRQFETLRNIESSMSEARAERAATAAEVRAMSEAPSPGSGRARLGIG